MIFENYGYKSSLDETWRELTSEEKEKYNIPKNNLNYLVNETKRSEFMVVYDGFNQNKDDIENFYTLCANTLKAHNFKILDEETFTCNSQISNQKIIAKKCLSFTPNGIFQVSYFMRLSGLTPHGYMYGCLTTTVNVNHDDNESNLIEAISNWTYLDVK